MEGHVGAAVGADDEGADGLQPAGVGQQPQLLDVPVRRGSGSGDLEAHRATAVPSGQHHLRPGRRVGPVQRREGDRRAVRPAAPAQQRSAEPAEAEQARDGGEREGRPEDEAPRPARRPRPVRRALRRLRFTAPELADLLDMPVSTISAVLKRMGMGKLGRLGLEPAVRYERERPGELIHIDVKKLGRITRGAGKRVTGGTSAYSGRFTDAAGTRRGRAGWDAVHVAVDDATRLAYAEVLPDEKATTAIAFLRRAVEFYARHGIRCERVITDNGSPYKSAAHAIACRVLGIRHLRTRPYRPQTNGKAERFIRTSSAAGPTARSTAQAKTAPPPLTAGFTPTTITADTQPSADNRPSTG